MNIARKRHMRNAGILTLLVVFILPLIPYAISAVLTPPAGSTEADVQVPNPSTVLWQDVRQRGVEITGKTQVQGVDTGVLINKTGEEWRKYRMEILVPYGAYLMGGILALILLFYLVRGSLKIPGGLSGKKILRFTLNERMVHWFTVLIFWLLGVTGLILLYGRMVLIPLLGPAGFSITASASKEMHNLIGPLFLFAMLALIITFIKDNFYSSGDMKWLFKAGGLLGGHVSAGRFNAGEKIWFWIASIFGLALCITGLILDFAILGQGREVMALSHVIHSISAIVMISISFGHIYLGTAGMQGSFSSMANGYVDENWAKAHHDRWYEQIKNAKSKDIPVQKGGVATSGVADSRKSD